MLGIQASDERPVHSDDAELAPDGAGGVKMRINPDRPETRQRFSIGHEITHTFFPGYELKVQCRPDPRLRGRESPDDFIETLCDVGAAEIVLPMPWFANDAACVKTAQDLVNLANIYAASRETTVRRFAETHKGCIAALFLSWKLKPTQARSFNLGQSNLFGVDPVEEMLATRALRLDYSIPSERFSATRIYLPKDKSLNLVGPLQTAADGSCADGGAHLSFGAASAEFRIMAIPLFTPRDERGPNGEYSVAAVIEPLKAPLAKRKKRSNVGEPGLF